MILKRFADIALGAILPGACAVCGAAGPDVCQSCRRDVTAGSPAVLDGTRRLRKTWTCGIYSGKLRQCLLALKFMGKTSVLPHLADLISNSLPMLGIPGSKIDLLLAVPADPVRGQARGVDHSGLICGNLSRALRVPAAPGILEKTRSSAPQTGLSRELRTSNLKGRLRVNMPRLIRGRNVIVVDDILTTGATLTACARELAEAGAHEIYGFALARTVRGKRNVNSSC